MSNYLPTNQKTLGVLMIFFSAFPISAQAQTSIEFLTANCSKKVKTVTYQTFAESEKINAFCHGYLFSSFEHLASMTIICPDPATAISPDYLWSIVNFYLKKAIDIDSKASAQQVVSNAFLNAFPCPKQ